MAQSTQYGRSEDGLDSSDLKDKAVHQLNNVADAVEDVASRVAEQGRAAGQQLRDVAGNVGGAVEKSLKDQPMATLAVVAAIGFVLGAVWKS